MYYHIKWNIGELAVGVQSANIKSANLIHYMYESITSSKSYSMSTWNMAMLHYLKRTNDTVLHSVVPYLSGKDIHLVNAGVKHSMEETGTEKKRSKYNDYF